MLDARAEPCTSAEAVDGRMALHLKIDMAVCAERERVPLE